MRRRAGGDLPALPGAAEASGAFLWRLRRAAGLSYDNFLTFSTEGVTRCRQFAEEGLAIARQTGNQHILARSLCYLGLADQAEGDVASGDRRFEASLATARAAGFADTVATSLTWLGAHANWRGEFAKAIDLSGQAADAAREIHDGLTELISLAFMATAQVGLGEHVEALATIEDTLKKARERDNLFIAGRLTNTLGWLYQEVGDFRRAVEYDGEGLEVGRQARNANVEVSSLINLGLDELHLGDPRRALAMLEETRERVEKHAFGAHRWRWSNHLSAYLAEALLAAGEHGPALAQAERALGQARSTGSLKYLGKAHLLRGQVALAERAWDRAAADFAEALRLARQIAYPNLTWQAAHLLARAEASRERIDEAAGAARLASDAIDAIAGRLTDAALRRTFLAWSRVQAAREDLDRLLRA